MPRVAGTGRVRLVGAVVAVLVTALVTATVTAGTLVATSTSASAAYKKWGRISAPDQPLLRGCNKYFFRYRVNPPRDEWIAEMFVVTPDGLGLYHTAKDSEFDPNRDKVRFTVCKPSTDYGRHKLRMKITWYEDDPGQTSHTGWVKPRYFRLYRP